MSLVQKGQTSGCSICSGIVAYGGGDIDSGAKRSNQWMQWIVVFIGGNIVFSAKRSNQWMQWNSGIWWCVHCILHPLRPLCTASIYHYSTVSIGLTFLHQRQCFHHDIPLFHCVHWFDLFAPKTMSPPPYTNIPQRPLHPLRPPLPVTFVLFLHNLIFIQI